MEISETHWPSTDSCQSQEHMVYYSGKENPTHRNGVGIVITKEIHASIKNFIPYTDRMPLLQLRGSPMDINIIQVYAPTADKKEQIIEEF